MEQKKKGIDFVVTPATVVKNTSTAKIAEPAKQVEPNKNGSRYKSC
jgi:hypothetical protein